MKELKERMLSYIIEMEESVSALKGNDDMWVDIFHGAYEKEGANSLVGVELFKDILREERFPEGEF